MIEAELLNELDFAQIIRFLDDRLSDRKRRLLAVAFCRLVADLFDHPDLLAAVEAAERYADGAATGAELEACRSRCRELAVREYEVWAGENDPTARAQRSDVAWAMAFAATTPVEVNAVCGKTLTAGDQLRTAGGLISSADAAVKNWLKDELTLAHRARVSEVVGNPFSSVEILPEWRTSTAIAIAAQMYDSRDFSAMPILADALQDAGCDSDAILNHCREPGTHVRGCWVVDLVLDKS